MVDLVLLEHFVIIHPFQRRSEMRDVSFGYETTIPSNDKTVETAHFCEFSALFPAIFKIFLIEIDAFLGFFHQFRVSGDENAWNEIRYRAFRVGDEVK